MDHAVPLKSDPEISKHPRNWKFPASLIVMPAEPESLTAVAVDERPPSHKKIYSNGISIEAMTLHPLSPVDPPDIDCEVKQEV
jgi:hypothetical protein